jgi:hypothetical protein
MTTAGPWRWCETDELVDSNGNTVLIAGWDSEFEPDIECSLADRALIASAPDLYAACAAAAAVLEPGSEQDCKRALRMCRDALAKARGNG